MSKLHEVKIHRLHPTQITVGMAEVLEKKASLAELHGDHLRDFLAAHPMPAVEGPNDKLYITDHHHLARALSEEQIAAAFFLIEADFSTLAPGPFWLAMESNHWVHPYDEHGILRAVGDIPKEVVQLRDDPYRSLAGFVRNAGGYRKTETAYAEFLWANFFRSRIVIGQGSQAFAMAVAQGIVLAHAEAARGLPGYTGPG
jgi:hypothetical protein